MFTLITSRVRPINIYSANNNNESSSWLFFVSTANQLIGKINGNHLDLFVRINSFCCDYSIRRYTNLKTTRTYFDFTQRNHFLLMFLSHIRLSRTFRIPYINAIIWLANLFVYLLAYSSDWLNHWYLNTFYRATVIWNLTMFLNCEPLRDSFF